ncbi:unnamed protein product, partial [Choristocarpus tenellus]
MMQKYTQPQDGKRKRLFVSFSADVQDSLRWYCSQPSGSLLQNAKRMPSWLRLRDGWTKEKMTFDQKAGLLQGCTVELLEREREVLEKRERERRSMFREEQLQRREDEGLRRAVERQPREEQEAGCRKFCKFMDTIERRHSNLSRLRWELTEESDMIQGTTVRLRDAATNRRYICRIMPCQDQDERTNILKELSCIQDIQNPNLVKVKDVYTHHIALYGENGEQTTGQIVIIVLIEHCAGGRLKDQMGSSSMTLVASQVSSHRKVESFDTSSEACFTNNQERKSSRVTPPLECWDPQLLSAVPCCRKLERWVCQVAHALSAMHKEGVVHRNINAGNVYLDERGRAKLGGYQCLKVASQWPGLDCFQGGYGYPACTPPEYHLTGIASPEGDIWSLGCALYMWTTGCKFWYLSCGKVRALDNALQQVPCHFGNK